MKKFLKPLMFSLVFAGFVAFAQISLAQAPPPTPPSGAQGSNGNKGPSGGGGAPIDGGLAVSLAMVVGFGAWKLLKAVQMKRKTIEN